MNESGVRFRLPLGARVALVTTGVLVWLGMGELASAQTTVEWNRRASAISLTSGPAAPGGTPSGTVYPVIHWQVESSFSSAPRDLGATIELQLNGTTIASIAAPVSYLPAPQDVCFDPLQACGSASFCASFLMGTSNFPGICKPSPIDGECRCSVWISSIGPGIAAVPGDEITIVLLPAPGALPETVSLDDQLSLIVPSTPKPVPNRGIESLQVTPDPTGPGLVTVHVEGFAQNAAEINVMDLSTRVHLLVGGIVVGSFDLDILSLPASFPDCVNACSGFCFSWGGSFPGIGNCHYSIPTGNCGCSNSWLATFPGVPVTPGDLIEVVLVPLPGALPELPGFGEDDEEGVEVAREFVRGDCNVDNLYNIADAIKLLGDLFNNDPPAGCTDACDANDDGFKNIADGIFMLSNLFAQGPPPPAPHPSCGIDPTVDTIGCQIYPWCLPM